MIGTDSSPSRIAAVCICCCLAWPYSYAYAMPCALPFASQLGHGHNPTHNMSFNSTLSLSQAVLKLSQVTSGRAKPGLILVTTFV